MPPIQRIDIKPTQEALAPVDPCTLVIFGGSGDLARRRLIPALYNLLLDGLLPSNFAVIGLGRKPMTDEHFGPPFAKASLLIRANRWWKSDGTPSRVTSTIWREKMTPRRHTRPSKRARRQSNGHSGFRAIAFST